MGEASKSLTLVQGEKEGAAEPGRTVAKGHLVNRLNYLNFQDQTILVQLRHVSYDNAIFLRARPLPCAGERLECVWAETPGLTQLLRNYQFDYLLIPDGKKYLLVKSDVVAVDEQGVNLVLPLTCHEFQERRIKRHPVDAVGVQIAQHGAQFRGEVVDFTPVSLRVEGSVVPPATLHWFNTESPIDVRLARGKSLLYSGSCRVLSQGGGREEISLVLMVENSNVRRYKSKRYRNIRQQLVPSPNIVFEHPLIGKRVNLKIADLSGTGFAVEENEGESVLMPGLILPELKLSFAQGVSVRCTAQVVFRNPGGELGGERTVRCGIAILNMEIRDHVKLLSLLHQVENRRSYVCTDVDLDDLWDFFFETGFIYPGKYAHFQANKEKIKKIYAKLYGKNPHIARHFIYMERGAILGHMAMVRFYRDSWMIHHHAARKTVTIRAGLAVLDQVSHYLNELENFSFAHLRFVYCYYRPDNKFPNRVFGGFARGRREPQVCSEDRFAYWHHRPQGTMESLPKGWELVPGSQFDLNELGNFYRFASGGLMTEAFDLRHGEPEDELAREYRALGFKKEKYYYALRKDGSLKAFILVNGTDAGFNMADLTNCVTLMVLDQELPRPLVELALAQASRHYQGGEMPVLAYPLSYLEGAGMPYDKVYMLWILNLQYSDSYFEYCEGMFRTVKKAPPLTAGE
jgi:hypothetical protein